MQAFLNSAAMNGMQPHDAAVAFQHHAAAMAAAVAGGGFPELPPGMGEGFALSARQFMQQQHQ